MEAGTQTRPRAVTLAAIAALGLAGLVALGLALRAAPASGAFPGANGQVVFASDRTGDWEIWIMNADGSGERQLTHSPRSDDVQPAFSSDGRGIVFASNRDQFPDPSPPRPPPPRRESDFEIYSMTTAGDEVDANGNYTLMRWTKNFCSDRGPAFAPGPYLEAATTIAYSSKCQDPGRGEADYNLLTKPWRLHDFGPRRLTDTEGDDGRPSYSDDGRRIVYDGIWPKGNFNRRVRLVTVMNSDGSNRRPLIPDCFRPWVIGQRLSDCTEETSTGTFSPDGDRIAYSYKKNRTASRNVEIVTRGIGVVDLDGRDEERVTQEQCSIDAFHAAPCSGIAIARNPAFSPDGRRLVYELQANEKGDKVDIWSLNVDSCTGNGRPPCGRSSKQLTSEGRNVQPDWGPKPLG